MLLAVGRINEVSYLIVRGGGGSGVIRETFHSSRTTYVSLPEGSASLCISKVGWMDRSAVVVVEMRQRLATLCPSLELSFPHLPLPMLELLSLAGRL